MELIALIFFYVFLRILPWKGYLWLFLPIILSGIFQAVYGVLQLTGYLPSLHPNFNITGSFFNPGPFAGFLAIVGNMAIGAYLFKKDILMLIASNKAEYSSVEYKVINVLFEYIPIIGLITFIIILPATHSRAAWLSFIFGALIMLSYKFGISNRFFNCNRFKRMVISSIAFIIIVTSFYGIYHFKKESADGRMLIWKITSNIIKNNSILGVGHDRFKAYYMNAQADYFNKGIELSEAMVADNSYYAFNDIIQFVSEHGLLGFVLTIAIIVFCLRIKTTREKAFLKPLSIGILSSVIVFGMFSYPIQILPIKTIWVFSLVILVNIDREKIVLHYKKKSSMLNSKHLWLLKSCLLFTGVIAIWIVNTRVKVIENSFKDWKAAVYMHNLGIYNESIKSFEKAFPVLQKDGDFLMNYGKTFSLSGQHKKTIETLNMAKRFLNTTVIETTLGNSYQALREYEKAERAYQVAVNMVPSRFYPHYLLAKLYDESGQKYKAEAKAQELLQKAVKVPSPAINEMLADIEKIIKKNKHKKTSGF